jgi:hypothetical protein
VPPIYPAPPVTRIFTPSLVLLVLLEQSRNGRHQQATENARCESHCGVYGRRCAETSRRPGFFEALGLPSKREIKRYGSLHALSIHLCSQRLHLWVTAYAHDLVYRELIRKYFGTEIMQGAEVDNGCRFLGRGSGVLKQSSRACVCFLNVRVWYSLLF